MIQERWYQKDAEAAIHSYYENKSGNCVVALPTGTGKSVVIGKFTANVLKQWPNQRFMMLTHVKELIEQNANKLLQLWPNAPLGVYSAGLGYKETRAPIIFGGVASVAKNVEAFGHRDLILVDECHLVSPKANTQYGEVFSRLLAINPHLKIVGFSATPFRLGQGYITDGGVFTDICYDLTGVDSFNRLIAEGFLSPLIPKQTGVELDVSNVKLSNDGDFKQNELQDAVDKEKITFKALEELMQHSQDRNCGLIFATGIEHAEHINEMLQRAFNQTSVVIHSKKSKEENKLALNAWKAGTVKWAVSMNSLTTGVDNPMIDVIGMLRPTMSPVLWVQMLGRGTRPCPQMGKRNCLVLDFAGNTRRLGPINDPIIPRKKGKGTGEVPIKICYGCGCYNHASARVCINCGAEFTIRVKFKDIAGTEELISAGPQVEYFDVNYVIYNRHQKGENPATIRASYFCGMQKFDEWVCLDHKGFARKKALDWLRQRMALAPEYEDTATTDNVLKAVSQLRPPKRIRVWTNKVPYPEVLGYEY